MINTVISLESKLLSERLSKQQGLFLMPTNPEKTFWDNLKSAFRVTDIYLEELDIAQLIEESNSKRKDVEIIRFDIPKNIHEEILSHLERMNITYEMLFPGLDGLAKSLVQTQVRKLSM